MEAAVRSIKRARAVIANMAARLATTALWVNAEADSAMWDCVALLKSIGSDLRIARGLIEAGVDSAEQYAGSLLDSSVIGRGLLYHSLGLCIEMDVIDTKEDVARCCELLDVRALPTTEVIVAYLDYLGTTKGLDGNFVRKYSAIGRDLATGLPNYRWRAHYWTASDTYCLFGILDARQLTAQIGAFLGDLIWVQRNRWARQSDYGWMWQIGVAVARATVLGDVLIPTRETARAATLMKQAKRLGVGGLITVDAEVCTRAGCEDVNDLLAECECDRSRLQITPLSDDNGRIDAYEMSEPLARVRLDNINLVTQRPLAGQRRRVPSGTAARHLTQEVRRGTPTVGLSR